MASVWLLTGYADRILEGDTARFDRQWLQNSGKAARALRFRRVWIFEDGVL